MATDVERSAASDWKVVAGLKESTDIYPTPWNLASARVTYQLRCDRHKTAREFGFCLDCNEYACDRCISAGLHTGHVCDNVDKAEETLCTFYARMQALLHEQYEHLRRTVHVHEVNASWIKEYIGEQVERVLDTTRQIKRVLDDLERTTVAQLLRVAERADRTHVMGQMETAKQKEGEIQCTNTLLLKTVGHVTSGRTSLSTICGAVPYFQGCIREFQEYADRFARDSVEFRTDLRQLQFSRVSFVHQELQQLHNRTLALPPQSCVKMKVLEKIKVHKLRDPTDQKFPNFSSVVATDDPDKFLVTDSENCKIKAILVKKRDEQTTISAISLDSESSAATARTPLSAHVPSSPLAAATASSPFGAPMASSPLPCQSDMGISMQTIMDCGGCPGGVICLQEGEYYLTVEWYENNRLFLVIYTRSILDPHKPQKRFNMEAAISEKFSMHTGSIVSQEANTLDITKAIKSGLVVYVEERKIELDQGSSSIESSLVNVDGRKLLVAVARLPVIYEFKWRIQEQLKGGATAIHASKEMKCDLSRRVELPARLARMNFNAQMKMCVIALEDKSIRILDRHLKQLFVTSPLDNPIAALPPGQSWKPNCDYLKPSSVLLIDFADSYSPYEPLLPEKAGARDAHKRYLILVNNWAKSSIDLFEINVPVTDLERPSVSPPKTGSRPTSGANLRPTESPLRLAGKTSPKQGHSVGSEMPVCSYKGTIANKLDVRCWAEQPLYPGAGRLVLFDQLSKTLAICELFTCYFILL